MSSEDYQTSKGHNEVDDGVGGSGGSGGENVREPEHEIQRTIRHPKSWSVEAVPPPPFSPNEDNDNIGCVNGCGNEGGGGESDGVSDGIGDNANSDLMMPDLSKSSSLTVEEDEEKVLLNKIFVRMSGSSGSRRRSKDLSARKQSSGLSKEPQDSGLLSRRSSQSEEIRKGIIDSNDFLRNCTPDVTSNNSSSKNNKLRHSGSFNKSDSNVSRSTSISSYTPAETPPLTTPIVKKPIMNSGSPAPTNDDEDCDSRNMITQFTPTATPIIISNSKRGLLSQNSNKPPLKSLTQTPTKTPMKTPKTPTPNYVPSSLASYIQTAEKELEDMVKDTLTSPIRKFPNMDAMAYSSGGGTKAAGLSAMDLDGMLSPLPKGVEEACGEEIRESERKMMEMQDDEEESLQEVQKVLNLDDDAEVEVKSGRILDKMNETMEDEGETIRATPKDDADDDIRTCTEDRKWKTRMSIHLAGSITLAIIAVLSTSILLSTSIYPVSPLIQSTLTSDSYECGSNQLDDINNEQCKLLVTGTTSLLISQSFKVSMATFSFALATTLRTVIMAPLIRFHDRYISSDDGQMHTLNGLDRVANAMESFSFQTWEETARNSRLLESHVMKSSSSPYLRPPELDLNMLVPCEEYSARQYLLVKQSKKFRCMPYPQIEENDNHDVAGKENVKRCCALRDIITRSLLTEYMSFHFDEDFDLATHPVLLKNMWPPESFENEDLDVMADTNLTKSGGRNFESGPNSTYRRRLTPKGIMEDPELSTFLLPNHFSDAASTGYSALVPDATAPTTLSQFVGNILSGKTPNAKIGTQVIVEAYPDLMEEIVPLPLAKELFGWYPWIAVVKVKFRKWFGGFVGNLVQKFPSMSYFPIFIAGNQCSVESSDSDDSSTNQHEENRNFLPNSYPRTDLHTEPIGNIAVQLHGTRRWTLIPTKWSGLLRPSVSKHGRGYFYSNLDPITELPERLQELPAVYEIVTTSGDAVWVPPWTWHRVDYDSGSPGSGSGNEIGLGHRKNPVSLSIGASVFHFYPQLFANNIPLFALLIVPNLVWEVLGFNTE